MLPSYLKIFLLPPANLFLLALFGLVILRWRPRFGRFLLAVAFLALYVLSTPLVSRALISLVQQGDALTRFDHDVGTIVVLGTGNNTNAVEYGGDTVGTNSLIRLRYGVRLNRLSGRPLMVSGGRGSDIRPSEAEAMAQTLEQSFGVTAKWVEDQSANTYENAVNTAAILLPLGITKIYLVTNSWHMRRSIAAFEAAGLNVIPAPTGIRRRSIISLAALIPNAKSLSASATAFHEWLGLIWYEIAYF